jgi:hypothetical protein
MIYSHLPFGNRIAQWNVAGRVNGVTISGKFAGGIMSVVLIFVRKWNAWYRVLRYPYGFNFMDSLRYSLWLARG